MYKTAFEFLKKYISEATLFKHGFNISPMYRRSVARIIYVSENLQEVLIRIPLNYKNRNYVGSIYGGSMLSATDPIYMTQLMNILGNDFVVWDKATTVRYKRPAREQVFAKFIFSDKYYSIFSISMISLNLILILLFTLGSKVKEHNRKIAMRCGFDNQDLVKYNLI